MNYALLVQANKIWFEGRTSTVVVHEGRVKAVLKLLQSGSKMFWEIVDEVGGSSIAERLVKDMLERKLIAVRKESVGSITRCHYSLAKTEGNNSVNINKSNVGGKLSAMA
jgi:hypothetical protein